MVILGLVTAGNNGRVKKLREGYLVFGRGPFRARLAQSQ
jgi:hypothetical protein